METELQGQLERITFHNGENHFTIAKIKVRGRKDLVTIVGNLFPVAPGEVLKVSGVWDRHPKFGEQFRFSTCEIVAPATVQGIEKYLGSGLIKGIGPVTAKRLVGKFGAETLEIIEHQPGRLMEVEGIAEKKLAVIIAAWQEQREVRDVMLFLKKYDVSTAYASKIYRQYGKASIAVVKENPYRLATEIFGIGFKTADGIAARLGIPKDSPMRAEAGILHILHQSALNGNVFSPSDRLLEECGEILTLSTEILRQGIASIASEKKVVLDNEAVYLAEYFAAEKGIARHLRELTATGRRLFGPEQSRALESVQEHLHVTLAENQCKAVSQSLHAKVMVITGGPGTGKTTIIKAIITLHAEAGLRILLAAPTGRAAKRMAEATGCEAKTIHRLLEYSPKNEGGFKRTEQNPLNADLIVIDEASMVDTLLMYHLLKAVPKEATLILVGDIDQLPSVGPGNVLRDIIDSAQVPCIRLDRIFRQAGRSLIVVNAHQINRGEQLLTAAEREEDQDFYFIPMDEPEKVLEKIIELCTEKVPEKFAFDSVDDIQVLTPMHRGVVGASNLNIELQKHLNSSADELHRGGRIFKTKDKVMQLRNNYDKDVFNGDIGRIASIDREDQEMAVDFDGKTVFYDFSELDELTLAYAISVHKSQGSEYPVVILPLLTQHYMLLQRNLLYTAVTRGRKLVILIGSRKAVSMAIRNNKTSERHTKLKERLVFPD